MKKIIYPAIAFLLVYGGYRYVRAYFDFHSLRSQVDLLISEPQFHTESTLRTQILAKATELGIPLSEEDIEVSIGETDRASLGELLIERPGIEVESKLLTVRFRYPVQIVGLTKAFSYEIEKPFTAKTTLVKPGGEP
jgi:hypothetical protein